jgi:ribosomal-protein-serine acetyltransferase
MLNFLTRNYARYEDDQSGAFAIYFQNELVGLVDLHKIDKGHNKTTIGYWLRSNMQGKGIMSSSVKAILNYGFNDLGLKRIGIQAAATNKPSRGLAERLSFHFEGVERAGNKLADGVYLDMAIYSILAEEFGGAVN